MNKSTKSKSEYCIQTVDNALRILEAFEHAESFGVSELSRDMDLHKNNVFRLLATLQQRGYVEQCDDSDRYRLGASCLRLGRSFTRWQDVVQRSHAVLEELVSETGEVAHLAVLRGLEVFHLDGVAPGNRLMQCRTRTGDALPAHATALGKVLLACNDDGTRRAFAERVQTGREFEARAEQTIVDPDKLAAHLQEVRVAGYAIDLEECEEGLHCAAVPVHGSSDELVAAISISGPKFRLGEAELAGPIRELLVDSGEKLSRALGWQG